MSVQLAAILCFCSFVQGAAGFGFGIFAVPFMVWAGLSLGHAVIITALVSFAQGAVSVFSLRGDVPWRRALYATALRMLTLPLGVWLLVQADNLNPDVVKQLLGGVLLIILALQLFVRPEPRDELHPVWGVLTFTLSGLLKGMVAMGGPPVVLWVMAQTWTNKASRGFLLAFFLLSHPPHLLLLYLAYRQEIWEPALQGLLYVPLVMLAAWLGVKAGNVLPKVRLRQVAYGLLFVVAVSSVFSQVLP